MAASRGTQIIFNPKWPKDWKERLAAQRDEGFQKRLDAWDREQDSALKAQKLQEIWSYWDERRKQLGIETE